MSLEDLYKAKGKLTTEIEIAQAHLQQVNKQIIDLINQEKQQSLERARLSVEASKHE